MSVSSSTAAAVLIAISCLSGLTARTDAAQYLGKFLGKLTELHHGVSGEVYAVDSRTLHIKDFTYDGQGPAAYFFAGNSRTPANTGFRIRDENGSPDVLRRYRKEGVTITLPEGKTLSSIKWFSVWCEEFEVNFGDVKIPRNFEYPRPQKIDALRGVHGVASSSIVIVDAQTLLVPDLSYDGEAPDAKFWVGRGSKPTPQGTRVPDENGKEVPLRRYDRKTVVLTLPGDLTVFDIGHFGIWCEAFTVDFGHVQIPQGLNIPPSLKMLGVSPQKRPRTFQSDVSGSHHQQTPLVGGGQVEATTYRPVAPFVSRRSDNAIQPGHELAHRDVYSRSFQQNSLQQQQQQQQPPQQYQQLNYNQQQFYQAQPTNFAYTQVSGFGANQQQQGFSQNFIQPSIEYTSHLRQPIPYTPFNQITQQQQQIEPHHQQQQQLFTQEQQLRRIDQEQVLQNQLNKRHSRFDIPSLSYQQFG